VGIKTTLAGARVTDTTNPVVVATTANTHGPAAATAAVLTFAALSTGRWVLPGVEWSYDAAPTGGSLQVEDGSGTVVWKVNITAAGPGFIPFSPPICGSENTAMIVTLASGAGAVVGKVNARPFKDK
jgi:hypothetical protein